MPPIAILESLQEDAADTGFGDPLLEEGGSAPDIIIVGEAPLLGIGEVVGGNEARSLCCSGPCFLLARVLDVLSALCFVLVLEP